MKPDQSAFVAPGQSKGRWRIRIIRAGLSGNRVLYPEPTLREAAPIFNGARVFVKSDDEHIAGKGKDFRNLIGRVENVSFIEGTADLQGDLQLMDPDGEINKKLLEAWDKGMSDLFGFSIDAVGATRPGRADGKKIMVAKDIRQVNSVDLIISPGAGGAIINLIEAKRTDDMEDDEEFLTPAEVRRYVEAAKLPAPAASRIIDAHADDEEVTEEKLREAVKKERDYLAKFTESGTVQGLGDVSRIDIVEDRSDKVVKMLDAFFDPKDRSVRSLRECYLDCTGDKDFTGFYRNCDNARMRESLGTQSFPDALGDSIARRMIADYNTPNVYDVWRQAVRIVPVNDFRVQERTRIGGYGDIPLVAERAPYTSLTSPTDEKATYQIQKRGGTEDLTLEMIANDDVSAVMQIPNKLSRSAKRTIGKFVLDHIKDNPAIYDEIALFHNDHGNLGTAALDGTSLAAARVAMKGQKEKDSEEKLGIGPRYLWVPDELEEAAVNLFRRSTENDRTFLQGLSLEVMPVWYWEDANDWAITADTNDVPFIELGFFNGNEEPELFIQDSPTSGSMFSNDVTTYKIRHIYGGTVVDYRGAYKGVVTS